MRFLSGSVRASFVVFVTLCLCSAVSHAATYYVSASGNDSNNGQSPGAAWRSVNKVNSVNFVAGDTILFEGGRIFAGNLYFDSADRGTASNQITIGSYGSGRSTINGGSDNAFLAYNTAGLAIKNINFTGSGPTANKKDGVSFFTDLPGNVKLAGITLDGVEVSGFGNCGIHIGSWNNQTGYRDVHIVNVVARDNLHAGIATYAQVPRVHANVYIGYSRAFNNFGNPASNKNTGSGIVLGGVTGAMIERSVAFNNGKNNFAPTEGPVGIWAYNSDRVVIQFNEAYANRTGSGKDGGGFDLDIDVQNSVMQYNYSHDNDGAGYLLCCDASNSGNVIRYNISQNDGRKNGYAAIFFFFYMDNTEIYNNTIYMNQTGGSPRAVYLQSGTTNMRFRNNIFYTAGGARLIEVSGGQSGLLFQGNCYFASGAFSIMQNGANFSSFDAWRNATGQESLNGSKTGFNLDPQLNGAGAGWTLNNANALFTLSAYTLKDSSPLVDQGLNLNSFGVNPGPSDFFGGAVMQGAGHDVGAHERSGTTPPNEPVPPAPPVVPEPPVSEPPVTPPTVPQPELAGKPQIFFQKADGRIAFWGMQDSSFIGAEWVRGGLPANSNWRVVTAIDLNGDGSRDLVFQHNSGRLAAWNLQGGTFLGAGQLRPGTPPGAKWRTVTMADFNGDSKPDLLFQNSAGQLMIWQMDGSEFVSRTVLGQIPESGWIAFGASDFNGDGKPDILFRNKNGGLRVWLMDGQTFLSSKDLRSTSPTNGWKLAGLVDLNQNGHTDLLWRHADGRLAVWKMNRTDFVNSVLLRNGHRLGADLRVIGPK